MDYSALIHNAIDKLSDMGDGDQFFYAEQRRAIPGVGPQYIAEIRSGNVRSGVSMPVFLGDDETALCARGDTIGQAQQHLRALCEGFV